VRELAAVLGIRYRALRGGAFSHSSMIVLLDEQGIIRARTTNLAELDADFMRAVRAALK
jgi:protein SCO1